VEVKLRLKGRGHRPCTTEMWISPTTKGYFTKEKTVLNITELPVIIKNGDGTITNCGIDMIQPSKFWF
jgi:hypothetical protein